MQHEYVSTSTSTCRIPTCILSYPPLSSHGTLHAPRLWNTQIEDTCIVFRSWHVTSTFTFLVSFAIILLLGVSYEWLRKLQRQLDIQTAQRITRVGPSASSSLGLGLGASGSDSAQAPLLGSAPKLYVSGYILLGCLRCR